MNNSRIEKVSKILLGLKFPNEFPDLVLNSNFKFTYHYKSNNYSLQKIDPMRNRKHFVSNSLSIFLSIAQECIDFYKYFYTFDTLTT